MTVNQILFFLQRDAHGGNILRGLGRHLALAGIRGGGPEGYVIESLLVEVASALLPAAESARRLSIFDFERTAPAWRLVLGALRGEADPRWASAPLASESPRYWDALPEIALVADPRTPAELRRGVGALRTHFLARGIVEGLGRDAARSLLREVSQRHGGGSFSAADLEAAMRAVGIPPAATFGSWRDGPALPAFKVSDAELARLPGPPGLQVRVHVHNDQDVPGLVYLSADDHARIGSTPVRVGAHASKEVVAAVHPSASSVWLHTYLSLNREPLAIPLPHVADPQQLPQAEIFVERPSDWKPTVRSDDVLVDDLDADFQIATAADLGRSRLAHWVRGHEDRPKDNGLLPYQPSRSRPMPRTWYRAAVGDAWGEYRRTAVLVLGAGDAGIATAPAWLRAAGKWCLAYHLPSISDRTLEGAAELRAGRFTDHSMALQWEGKRVAVDLQGVRASPGWVALGTFDIPAGRVEVVVSKRKGRDGLVVFDAVRWRWCGDRDEHVRGGRA